MLNFLSTGAISSLVFSDTRGELNFSVISGKHEQ